MRTLTLSVLTALALGAGLYTQSGATPAGRAPTAAGAGSSCHADHTGACLKPDSPDYDCDGGSGDGPDYTGPVRSVGSDPYDLDRDGDGSACETS